MAQPRIEPHKIQSPIQLLAVWFTTLVLVDGAFLAAAATIVNPFWVSSMLAVASVLFVPIFLTAAFLMQTRFRIQLLDDTHFSEWQKTQDERLEQVKEQQEQQESHIHTLESIFKKLAEQQGKLGFVIKSMVTRYEEGLLRALARTRPCLIRYEPELYRRLERLDAVGFIKPITSAGLMAILERVEDERLPPEDRPGFDLKEYIELTEQGRKCLQELEELEALEKSG